jgi:hypothetical protein
MSTHPTRTTHDDLRDLPPGATVAWHDHCLTSTQSIAFGFELHSGGSLTTIEHPDSDDLPYPDDSWSAGTRPGTSPPFPPAAPSTRRGSRTSAPRWSGRASAPTR